MNKRKFIMVLAVILVIIAAGTVVFAESVNVKTHEYSYADKFFFNISDKIDANTTSH